MTGSWLLDAIRPRAYVAPMLPVETVAREGHAYARAAVGNCLGELAMAAPGTRNETAFRVGCRLVELCRAPWAGLSWEQVRDAFMATCATLNDDGTFRDGEAWSVWLKAERKAREPATLPPAAHLGTMISFSELPPGAAHFGAAAQAAAAADGQPGLAGGVLDPFEAAVRREHWMLAVRDEARKRLEHGRARPRDWTTELLTPTRLAEIEPPQVLVDGWLFGNSLSRIVGPSGAMKSFVAIDIACSVATGRAWHGHAVKQGLAVYVVGEGSSGTKARIDAWSEQTGLAIPDAGLLVLPWAVQTGGPEWSGFVSHLAALRPALVVLDTQARVTVGRDENSAQDMGEAVAAWDELRETTTANVMLVHHTGVSGGERGRGSGAVFGALTSETLVTRSGMNLTLSCKKQKDVELPAPLMLTANAVANSLVLIGAMDPDRDGLINPMPISSRDVGRERALVLVRVMRGFAGGNGGTKAEIKQMFMDSSQLSSESVTARRKAFQRAWVRLDECKRIGRNPLMERYGFIELDGLDDLEPNPQPSVGQFGFPTLEESS